MFNIKVERTLQANANSIFELLTDHANYKQFKVIESSQLLKAGDTVGNGMGATRVIKSGFFEVTEKVVAYQPSTLFGYQIVAAKPFRINHLAGLVELKSISESHTQVVWKSQGEVKVPFIGKWLDKKMEQNGSLAFASILKQINEILNTD